MKLSRPDASVFVPDGKPWAQAFRRVTHLGIGAHPDDLEIMAFHGILKGRRFGGITCTDGAGSPRAGKFVRYTETRMCEVRRREQDRAARLGRYGVMVQLRHPSRSLGALENDLFLLIQQMKPDVIYTHNLADKHATHLAVALATIGAIRRLPRGARPRRVYGCEVWRDLDWLDDGEKVSLDIGKDEKPQRKLLAAFRSQLTGKRYDEAVLGRARANATFANPRESDHVKRVWLAMDLSPLTRNPKLKIAAFVDQRLSAFRRDVIKRLPR
jgi:LmbE family N-acetylglucosaminyl deacetylase